LKYNFPFKRPKVNLKYFENLKKYICILPNYFLNPKLKVQLKVVGSEPKIFLSGSENPKIFYEPQSVKD